MQYMSIDRIQLVSIIFSLFIFSFIFGLVKNRRVKEEYSLLWFVMSIFFIYLSVDRYAIDRLGSFFGIAYKPSILMLITTGFIFLVLIHITIVITRLGEQNKELIQELALGRLQIESESDPFKGGRMKADILAIVPAYNEERNIIGVISDLRSIDTEIDILVVNDGSSDATAEAARSTGEAIVVDLPTNLGIGGAVQTGFKYAVRNGYQIAIQFDGDGQHQAGEIRKLLDAVIDRGANMAIGSRFIGPHVGFRSTRTRRIGIRLFEVVNSLLIGQRITDNTSGFRAYDREAIEFLAKHYPVDYPEPEAIILLGKNGFRIEEAPTVMRERQLGGSSISGLTSGYYMLKVLLAVLMTALRKPLRGR
ncbi:MAG: glycosyl transferase family [Geobacteraceae bacterium]|nr:MAG: glycosyl transferase family [Geobacteraceae bacterium]